MDLIANLFHQDPETFFKTDLENFPSFWDWLVHVRNPFNRENGHFWWEPAVRFSFCLICLEGTKLTKRYCLQFFANEVEIYTLALLTFSYAYRHGARYLYLWFAILWHGFTVELVSYWIEAIDNFWHAQSTFVFFGRREPMQIILVYPSYLFIAAIVTERMGLSGESNFLNTFPASNTSQSDTCFTCKNTELTQACTMGLLVVLIDFPYDILGIKCMFVFFITKDIYILKQ